MYPDCYNIADFGAASDRPNNITAIQQSIDAAARNGGGVVWIPTGCYHTGTIWLRSNITCLDCVLPNFNRGTI